MLAARDQSAGAGADAKVIEGEALPALPPPPESKPNRKRKRSLDVVVSDAEPPVAILASAGSSARRSRLIWRHIFGAGRCTPISKKIFSFCSMTSHVRCAIRGHRRTYIGSRMLLNSGVEWICSRACAPEQPWDRVQAPR